MICKRCKCTHDGEYGSGKYCSINCANSRGPRTAEVKNKISQKLKKNKTCLSCNSVINKRGKYCSECAVYSRNKDLYNKLNIYDINFKNANIIAVSIIENEYYNNNLSTPQIFEKYNIQPIVISRFLSKNNIKLRDLSSSISNAYYTGRKKINDKKQFKQGIHLTWDNKEIFYRSSYELEYAKILDRNKIKYEVESLKIKYWDSQLKKERTAIPDFYLPDYNLIVEIKSNYTYNKINIKDKSKAYKRLGYNFKLEMFDSLIAD